MSRPVFSKISRHVDIAFQTAGNLPPMAGPELCAGGIILEAAGRLAGDSALGQLVGLPRMADASSINLRLNRQTCEGSDALWKIIREVVPWVIARAPKEVILQ